MSLPLMQTVVFLSFLLPFFLNPYPQINPHTSELRNPTTTLSTIPILHVRNHTTMTTSLTGTYRPFKDSRPLHFQSPSRSHRHHPTRCVSHHHRLIAPCSPRLHEPTTDKNIEPQHHHVACAANCTYDKDSHTHTLTHSLTITPYKINSFIHLLIHPLIHPSTHQFLSHTKTHHTSIREFCPLSMPIFMYDKHGQYVVKTLEKVRSVWSARFHIHSFRGSVDVSEMLMAEREGVVVTYEFWT